jgi:hypothetical protein
MPFGRRLAATAGFVVAAAALAGCTQYTDTSPPTGEGRQLALVFLAVLLVPTVLLAGLLAWYHLYDRGDGPRRPPGTVAVAAAWCFLAGAVFAWPGAWAVTMIVEQAMGADTRGEERAFLDWGWFLVVVGVGSVCAAMLAATLGLAVLRGQVWARVTTGVFSLLAFAGALAGAATTAGSDGNGLVTSMALAVLAPVPIPFLLWWDAEEVFAQRSRPTPVMAPPALPAEPEPVPAERSLTDRWHSRG